MGTWIAELPARNLRITTEALNAFRALFVRDVELLSRMSEALWFDIFVHYIEFGIQPSDVLEAIHNVEAGEPHNGVKLATEFKNKPLKGLWHKHYFTGRFLPKNLSLALGKNGLANIVGAVLDPIKYPIITSEAIEELAHAMTHPPIEKRDAEGKITGEWVVFAKRDGKNYYLALAIHSSTDQTTYDKIMDTCTRDFPDLKSWLPA